MHVSYKGKCFSPSFSQETGFRVLPCFITNAPPMTYTGANTEKAMVNVMKWIKRWCFLLALSLLVLPVRAQAAVYEGLDVSVWQGEIDFSQVKAAGKEMVYIRAGYGLSEDSRFRENAEGARRAGMKVGFYFFVTATNQTQARAQAVYFSELIQEYPYDCRPAVDFEQYGTLSKGELNGIALAFAETLEERTGKTPAFYTNASSAAEIWEPALTRYPLWIADYGPPLATGHSGRAFSMRTMAGCPELRARWTWIGLLRVCCWSRAQRCPFWMCVLRTGMQRGLQSCLRGDCCRGLRRTGLDRTVPPSGLRW